ncbi:hypothetical protein [Rhizobium lusitanum]|uniref:hypothetical protein n=1 Tax=Rhizobium lusitanum TaxID=293958 RepID=UPI00195B174C|nr:hypothetical protein [Rhizobium lusitanum]MBM7048494.1 hypothetical protein [Rhizobium lusitanum]
MDEGVTAVRRRFPARVLAIDDLAGRSEEFRDICRDFAEAQSELAKWEGSTEPKREERRREYGELVAGLAKEIEDVLDRASVLPLHRPVPRSPS